MGDLLEHLGIVGLLGGQDRELVAAHPGYQPVGSDAVDQARPELAQELIAVVVAERVVDLLEAVEVQEHHRERLIRLAGVIDPLGEPHPETLAIGKAGQLVGPGDPLELLASALGRQQLGDEVLEDDQHDRHERQADRADLDRDEQGGDGQRDREQLRRQKRQQHVGELGRERASVQVALIADDEDEVQQLQRDERRERQGVVVDLVGTGVQDPGRRAKPKAAGEHQRRVDDEVVAIGSGPSRAFSASRRGSLRRPAGTPARPRAEPRRASGPEPPPRS